MADYGSKAIRDVKNFKAALETILGLPETSSDQGLGTAKEVARTALRGAGFNV